MPGYNYTQRQLVDHHNLVLLTLHNAVPFLGDNATVEPPRSPTVDENTTVESPRSPTVDENTTVEYPRFPTIDVNIRNDCGDTILHETILYANHLYFSDLLGIPGINVNAQNNVGNTPAHLIACCGQYIFLRHLVQAHANIDVSNIDGDTPLHFAAHANRINTLELLIKSGANINAENNYGNTPLHIAAFFGNALIVCKLLEYGANIHIINKEGHTAHDYIKQLLEKKYVFSTDTKELLIDSLKDAIDKQESSDEADSEKPSAADDSEPHSKRAKTTDTREKVSERSSSPFSDQEEKKQPTNQESSEHVKQGFFVEIALKDVYSWIHELPKFVQKILLDSVVIKSIIQHTKKIVSHYDIKSIEQDFVEKVTSVDSNVTDSYEDEKIHFLQSEENYPLIDTKMIFKGYVPMMSIGSGMPVDGMDNQL